MKSDLKYGPGRGPRRTSTDRPVSMLEKVTLAHVAIYLLFATWYFGGASPFARTAMSWWGTIGALILVVVVGDKSIRKVTNLKPLVWLWPLGAFNALVLVSCLNPNFRILDFGTDTGFIKIDELSKWVPSSALPIESLRGLWLFNGIYLSCFSLALTVSQRRALRWLLSVAGINAVALAVFGTVQKLVHSKGIYFGAVSSPQPNFFASFVYDNHWGAFVLLMTSLCLGGTIRLVRRQAARDFFHSPAFIALLGVLLLAISVPLSNSRACTILIVLLLGYSLATWLIGSIKRRRLSNESSALPISVAIFAMSVAIAAVWYVAGESIENRLETTRSQIAEMRAIGGIGSRKALYADTLKMAEDMPVFGWGMNSYPHVFMLYNSQVSKADDLPVFYNDAHSDWLQSLAEHGIVGTFLLALCAIVPLSKTRGERIPGPFPGYLIAGCGIVLCYSWVEFPFDNPAVVLCWWICFFSAIRYILLESPSSRKSP